MLLTLNFNIHAVMLKSVYFNETGQAFYNFIPSTFKIHAIHYVSFHNRLKIVIKLINYTETKMHNASK